MEPVAIALIRDSNTLFWQAVIESLENESRLFLHVTTTRDEVEQFLAADKSRLLIVEQDANNASVDVDYRVFTELHPDLAVVAIDATGLETFIRLKDLGKELLIKLVSAILTEKAGDNADGDDNKMPRSQVRHVGAADVIRLVPKSSLAGGASPILRQGLQWQKVCDWLDLCLHRCLPTDMGAGSSEVGVPGWAMSPAKARAILGCTLEHQDEEQLRSARRQLEHCLFSPTSTTLKEQLPALANIFQVFELDETEQKIFLLVFAAEIDGRYARVLGYLNDDLTRRRATPTLLPALLDDASLSAWKVREIIAGGSNLSRFQLIREDANDTLPASDAGLFIAQEISHYLLAGAEQAGDNPLNIELTLAAAPTASSNDDPADGNLNHRLSQWRTGLKAQKALPIMHLLGGDASADWLTDVCRQSGDNLVSLDIAALAESAWQNPEDAMYALVRTARLHQAIVLLKGFASLQAKHHEKMLRACLSILYPRIQRLAWVAEKPLPVREQPAIWYVERTPPAYADTKSRWRARAESQGICLADRDLGILATALKCNTPQMDAILGLARGAGGTLNAAAILEAARPFRQVSAPGSVRRIDASFTWNDIVLPAKVLHLLKVIPGHVRESGRVLDDWGYRSRMPYGHGVAALFSGPSGTGKTMAAQIIASELGVELFQVDLAKTISKYIGETEKNLDAVFDAADKAGAVLLFDEADALFGKRTEVRDAHDRYANVEVAYLLQRMEIYAGLAILTTNLRQNLDKAFMRRLRFVVDFPMPATREREAIWQASFPSTAPLGADVNFKFLARRLELSGGNIQQIAIRAAFSAAADNSSIEMHHIVHATRDELRKLGMNSEEKTLAEFIPDTRCAGL